MRTALNLLPLLLATVVATGAAQDRGSASSLAEQLDRTIAEFKLAQRAFVRKVASAKSEEGKQILFERENPAVRFAARIWKIVDADPAAETGRRGLLWIVSKGIPKDGDRALGVLRKHHHKSEAMARVISMAATTPSVEGGGLLEAILADHPDRVLRGRACLALGQRLLQSIDFRSRLSDSKVRNEVASQFGSDLVEHILTMDTAKSRLTAERYFERVVKEFSDVRTPRGRRIGDAAKRALFEIRALTVGNVAPEIEGDDLDGVNLKLSDYRGKVVLLDFWGHW